MGNFLDTAQKRKTFLGGFLILMFLTVGFAAGHAQGVADCSEANASAMKLQANHDCSKANYRQ
jgi:hypothetical protein